MIAKDTPGALPPGPHRKSSLYEILTAPQKSAHEQLAVRAALDAANIDQLWDAWDACFDNYKQAEKKWAGDGLAILTTGDLSIWTYAMSQITDEIRKRIKQ